MPAPNFVKKNTECGSQYPWRCCTKAGSNPDICPYAAYDTQSGDDEFGCHGRDYDYKGISLEACKEKCASQVDRVLWKYDCGAARWDHRSSRCFVIPWSTCWGDEATGGIQDGQSVSQIWRLELPGMPPMSDWGPGDPTGG